MSEPLAEIFAEVDARIAALATEEGGVYERMPSGDPARFPSLDAFDNGDTPMHEEEDTETDRMALRLTIAGLVKGTSGPAAHTALLALRSKVVRRIAGDPDHRLGSVECVESVRIGARRVDIAGLASKRSLGFEQDFLIVYSTVRGDPSQSA